MRMKKDLLAHLVKRKNPEGRLQLSILKYLRLKGYAAGKTKTMGVRNTDGSFRFDKYLFLGFPDVTAFVPELVFIEVKAPQGTQSGAQKDFQQFCKVARVKYILARSLEDVMKEV